MTLTLLTRAYCHLCDDMRAALAPLAARYGARIDEIDVDTDAALDAVGDLRRAVDSLRAVELFFQDGLDLVCDRLGLPRPFARPHGAFVLVEAAAHADPTAELAARRWLGAAK